jgi:hypothetical protein
MSDYEAIQSLLARYTDAINRRDFEVLPLLFATDGAWHVDAGAGRVFHFEGPEVVPGIRGLVEHNSFLAQIASLPVIEIDGDRARSRSMLQEVLEPAGQEIRFVNFGFYEDDMRKVNGQWVFQTRRFTMKNSNQTVPSAG